MGGWKEGDSVGETGKEDLCGDLANNSHTSK